MLGFCIHTLGIFWFIFLLLSAFTFLLGWVITCNKLLYIDTDTGYLYVRFRIKVSAFHSRYLNFSFSPFYSILTILYLNHDDMDTYLNKNPSDNPLESLETKSLGLNIRKFCERCALKMLPLFSLIITKTKKKTWAHSSIQNCVHER